jgi:LuxR family maltose regulon positive regulatory protein
VGLPRIDEHVVPRPRLLARFDDLPALTLVRAPMGAGKTTLVAQWASGARAADRQVLWLDGTVDPPAAVVDALAGMAGADVPAGLLPADALAALTLRLRSLEEPVVLVIDDFDPMADELGVPLMELLRRCRSVHLVLCVRGRHDFVWRAVAGADYQVITMDDLALTAEELGSYAESIGVETDPDRVAGILEATSGLASLVRVGLRARRGGGGAAVGRWSPDDVREFVRDHVHQVLEPADVAVVSAVAHLEGADLDVLRTALGPDQGRVLNGIQTVGTVERRQDSDRLYLRLPPLVTEVLQALHDPSDDAGIGAVHDRVIGELERSGRVLDAVALAVRAGRHEPLLALVKRHWWDIAAEDITQLAGALEAIPEELLAPRSALMRHLTELIPDRVTAEPLAEIESVPSTDDELRAEAEGDDAPAVLDGLMIGLMAARFRGERDKAVDDVRRGMVMVNVMTQDTQHDLPTSVRRFFVQAGLVHLLDLDLAAAELAFRRGYGPDEHESPDVLRREAANKLALVQALKGDHVATHAWLERAEAIDPPTGWLAPMIEAPRRMAEALLALDRLDRDEVERHLADLSSTILTDELWFMELSVRAASTLLWGGSSHAVLHEIQLARADRAHLLGEGTLASTQLLAWETALLMALGHGTEAETLVSDPVAAFRVKVVRARLLALSDRPREALALLASVTQTPHDFPRLRLEALLLTAQIHQQLGETDVARTYLVPAAVHTDFVSTFASVPRALIADSVDAIPALRPVLQQLDAHDLVPPFPESLAVVSLTERERQLVVLLPTSQSRDSIARSLFVSTNTIKTQLQALYRKLGVASREEAVTRAYELGLLR